MFARYGLELIMLSRTVSLTNRYLANVQYGDHRAASEQRQAGHQENLS